jgi:hypothetical protein
MKKGHHDQSTRHGSPDEEPRQQGLSRYLKKLNNRNVVALMLIAFLCLCFLESILDYAGLSKAAVLVVEKWDGVTNMDGKWSLIAQVSSALRGTSLIAVVRKSKKRKGR